MTICQSRSIWKSYTPELPQSSEDARSKRFNPARTIAIILQGLPWKPAHAPCVIKMALPIKLTPAEYELLLVMVKNAGVVLDRDYLLLSTRGRQAYTHDRAIDVRLSQLRKKLQAKDRESPLFSTVRGGGYMLDCGVEVVTKRQQ